MIDADSSVLQFVYTCGNSKELSLKEYPCIIDFWACLPFCLPCWLPHKVREAGREGHKSLGLVSPIYMPNPSPFADVPHQPFIAPPVYLSWPLPDFPGTLIGTFPDLCHASCTQSHTHLRPIPTYAVPFMHCLRSSYLMPTIPCPLRNPSFSSLTW